MMRIISFLFVLVMLFGCVPKGSAKKVEVTKSEKKSIDIRLIDYPSEINVGDSFTIGFDSNIKIDSVNVKLSDKNAIAENRGDKWVIRVNERAKMGSQSFRFNIYSLGKEYSRSGSYKVISTKEPKQYSAEVVKTIPMDKYFMQGLELLNDTLYVSSGAYGKSFIEMLHFPSLKSIKSENLEERFFAEGLTILNGKVYQLTWQEQKCFVYDAKTLKKITEFTYPYEGWGLTNDGKYLYLSDGSKYIYKLDPDTFKEIDRVEVMHKSSGVEYLNELEWINGEIWANVFTANYILRINPQTGMVNSVVFCDDAVRRITMKTEEDYINGIMYDKRDKSLYITGKNWEQLFKVTLR